MIAALRTRPDPAFWAGRRVLLTGHTGFKGSWAALWLTKLGARVTGLALAPNADHALFRSARVGEGIASHFADLRDREAVDRAVAYSRCEVVLHLAAQPIVRASVEDPVGTFATNVMGTAHLLDGLRGAPELRAALAITTDKVYANAGIEHSFVETDPLGGKDPYAASKAASELVVASFAQTYFDRVGVRLATARGGNVVGGGDASRDRLVADLVRAVASGERPHLRHPEATRPWQHVLDCIAGYLVYAEHLCGAEPVPRSLNFGPKPGSAPVNVGAVADSALRHAGWSGGWVYEPDPASIEASTLAIDASLARDSIGFESAIDCAEAIELTMHWHAAVRAGQDARAVTLGQIASYEARR